MCTYVKSPFFKKKEYTVCNTYYPVHLKSPLLMIKPGTTRPICVILLVIDTIRCLCMRQRVARNLPGDQVEQQSFVSSMCCTSSPINQDPMLTSSCTYVRSIKLRSKHPKLIQHSYFIFGYRPD